MRSTLVTLLLSMTVATAAIAGDHDTPPAPGYGGALPEASKDIGQPGAWTTGHGKGTFERKPAGHRTLGAAMPPTSAHVPAPGAVGSNPPANAADGGAPGGIVRATTGQFIRDAVRERRLDRAENRAERREDRRDRTDDRIADRRERQEQRIIDRIERRDDRRADRAERRDDRQDRRADRKDDRRDNREQRRADRRERRQG